MRRKAGSCVGCVSASKATLMAQVKNWPLWLGIASCWPIRYIPRSGIFFEECSQYGIWQLFGICLAYIGLLCFAYRAIKGSHGQSALCALLSAEVLTRAFCLFGILASVSFILIASTGSGFLAALGYFVLGFVFSFYLLFWFIRLRNLEEKASVICLALSTLALGIIDSIILSLPDQSARYSMVLLSLAGPALYALDRAHSKLHNAEEKGRMAAPFKINVGYWALAVVTGFSFGMISNILYDDLSYSNNYLLVATLFIMSAALFSVSFFSMVINWDFILFGIALPVVALCFLLLPLTSIPMIAINVICTTGVYFIHFSMTALLSSIKDNLEKSLLHFSLFYALLSGAECISSFLVVNLAIEDVASETMFTTALVVMYALFLAYGFINRKAAGGGRTSSESDNMAIVNMVDRASRMGLTQRERDVLELMLRNKKRKEMAVELAVSQETIKTHIHMIYKKMDVHSKDELMNKLK